MECGVCLSPFKIINKCVYCNYLICKKCFKKIIETNYIYPTCIICNRYWSREDLKKMTSNNYITKIYDNKIIDYILEMEIHRTMIIQNDKLIKKIFNNINKLHYFPINFIYANISSIIDTAYVDLKRCPKCGFLIKKIVDDNKIWDPICSVYFSWEDLNILKDIESSKYSFEEEENDYINKLIDREQFKNIIKKKYKNINK